MQTRPVELAAELRRLGCFITLRRLTDWRAKRLLPPLAKHGRGRGRGSFNAWDQANIVEQSVEIYSLLDAGSNAQDVLIALWVRGFAVDVGRVRKTLLRRLDAFEAKMNRDDKKYGGRKNRLSRWADMTARQIARGTNLLESDVRDFLMEVLVALFKKGVAPEREIDSAIIADTANKLSSSTTKRRDRIRQVEAGFDLLAGLFSIRGRRRLIKWATDEEMIEARDSWKSVVDFPRQVFGWLFEMIGEAPSPPRRSVRRLPIQLAPIGILVFLAIMKDERSADKSQVRS
jgi:hypothetical protein